MSQLEFVVARNPAAGSTLPYLIRSPLGPEGVVLKTRDSWPRTAKVRLPSVPIVFCETRSLAEEWTYRFLGAALDELGTHAGVEVLAAQLRPAGPVPAREPTVAAVRAWAMAAGLPVSDRGRLRTGIWEAYRAAHQG